MIADKLAPRSAVGEPIRCSNKVCDNVTCIGKNNRESAVRMAILLITNFHRALVINKLSYAILDIYLY